MRIFISSTCYDLIDLRAEMQAFFTDAGIEARLSDSLTSEFRVMPEHRNSIETCLANVRECDEFVIVLSQRYGPSLDEAGFGDVSATHLEYREAVKCKRPIRMYVRDRLDADYNTWKKNPKRDLNFLWCKSDHDQRLFELLKEHRELAKSKPQNNWMWTFGDSMQLKRRLAIDFKPDIDRVTINRLFENGRIPVIEMSGEAKVLDMMSHTISFELLIRNLSDAVALAPMLELGESQLNQPNPLNQFKLPSIFGTQEVPIPRSWHFSPGFTHITLRFRLSYSTLEGHNFVDSGTLRIDNDQKKIAVTYDQEKCRYVGASKYFKPVFD